MLVCDLTHTVHSNCVRAVSVCRFFFFNLRSEMGVTDIENLAAASPFKGLLSTGYEGLSSLQLSTPPLWGGCLHFTGAHIHYQEHS